MKRHAKRVTNLVDVPCIFNEQKKDWNGSFFVACSSLCLNKCAKCHALRAIWHACEKTRVRYASHVLWIIADSRKFTTRKNTLILKGMAQRCYKNRTQIHLRVRIDTKRAAFARKFCVWPRQHWDLKSSSRRIKQQRSLLCSGPSCSKAD